MVAFGVVTPSFNQAHYLPAAVESVMAQDGPFSVDYCVMDGGSKDDSTAYLKQAEDKYSGLSDKRLSWISVEDEGQYSAIQEGFSRVGGDILCWLNSDDMYTPWAFRVVAEIFENNPDVEWLTSVYPMTVDTNGSSIGVDVRWGYGARPFRKGIHLPGCGHHARYFVQQDCTFWRRSLWERAGARLDTSLDLAADFELWLRLFEYADLFAVASPLAGYRVHPDQKTARSGEYEAEAMQVLRSRGHEPCGSIEGSLRRYVAPALASVGLGPVLSMVGLADKACAFKHGGRGEGWNRDTRYIL